MMAGFLAQAVRALTGARARWLGGDPVATVPRIYFANHTSNLDFVLLWSSLPPVLRARTRPAAARDYWAANRWRRHIAEGIFRAVLIERKHVTRHNNPIAALSDVLASGESIIIFPEGGRRDEPDGGMGAFKSGLFHLARQRPEAELIPVFIDNLNRVLPKGEFLPVPIICSVTFGPPLAPVPGEGKSEFLERASRAVQFLAHS
jgi:1-acyl-sn-glycerol-3-phosphate acyltransferase